MNKTTAIFLVRPDVRCVSVSYDKRVGAGNKIEGTDIKSFKTTDPTIAEKDLVLIPTDTRWGFTVGRVEKTDLHVDFDSPEIMRWIVNKIDVAGHEAMLAIEAKMMDTVADADREHRKRELATKLFANVDPEALKALNFEAPSAPKPQGFEPGERGGAQQSQRDPIDLGGQPF